MEDFTNINQYHSLTEEEARVRLKRDGYNELPVQKQRGIFAILGNILKEPMLALLVGAGTIYILLGEPQEAVMLSSLVVFVIGITLYQEKKTEKAVAALRELSSPRARVIRAGVHVKIPGREVVADDIVIIKEGERVPADAYVINRNNLTVDESALTGESQPVAKTVWDGVSQPGRPGGENLATVYGGTLVVTGRALLKIYATGAKTQMGIIGKSLVDIKDEETLVRRETGRIVRIFTVVGAILCLFIVFIWGVRYGNWLDGILSGLSLSMSMLPEEFPVVLTIFFALGAWRLSKKQVLVRQVPVVETLGAASVLCVDKTGTITSIKMKLSALYVPGREPVKPDDGIIDSQLAGLLEYSALASDRIAYDTLEKDIFRVVAEKIPDFDKKYNKWIQVKEYPISGSLMAVTHVWQSAGAGRYVIASKGAPETILGLCKVTGEVKEEIRRKITEMAERGLRVLGVAKTVYEGTELPENQKNYAYEFVGLIGFADPVRPHVADAIAECYRAGIRVIMITGDYPGTAQSIARDIGLANINEVITGEELSVMGHNDLRARIKKVNIFARVLPEQKLFIVNALKANGEIVAMTGDGVNDAPALKSAHIGIAMGERGTDVAREASDIVLVNDDFASIVRAVRTGRKIYDNLKKAFGYIFAVHVPIAGITIIPAVLGTPVVLMPAHIAFLELVIDPACSTVFEAEQAEGDIMDKPPRNLREPAFNRNLIIMGLLQGASILAIVFILYLYSLYLEMPETKIRAMTFIALVTANLALIITNLSWKKIGVVILNKSSNALRVVLGLAVTALYSIMNIPLLRNLFHFSELGLREIITAVITGGISLLWFELFKLMKIKQVKAGNN